MADGYDPAVAAFLRGISIWLFCILVILALGAAGNCVNLATIGDKIEQRCAP